MKLVPVTATDWAHVVLLYTLLEERDESAFISHRAMPTLHEHRAFVTNHPFRYWFVIQVYQKVIGAIEATDRNEVGVTVLKQWRKQGYGHKALRLFLDTHQPLPAIPAIRNGRWLANIAPGNEASRKFFESMGFVKIQETFRHG